MRGVDVAEVCGVPFIDLADISKSGHWDALVLVKYWFARGANYAEDIRSACDRLIFDPLDCWSSTSPNVDPPKFWMWVHRALKFNEMILTSPAALRSATDLEREGVVLHMAPHHGDPRIGLDWYDPDGPVVYAGGFRFVRSEWGRISQACKSLKMPLVESHRKACWKKLRGASLVLHPRFSPEDTSLNRTCKPQVKAANAALAGIPILATPHPCFTSLYDDGFRHYSEISWAANIARALESQPIKKVITLSQYARTITEIVKT